MEIVSLFSGCGGLDLGFSNSGFRIVYASDSDKTVWETYEKNHHIEMDNRSIENVPSKEIPKADGIIGGPPCQSWSLAGEMRGAEDERGHLFYEYTRIIRDKRPKFFLTENVPGIISTTHFKEFEAILRRLEGFGYDVKYDVLDARDYGVPQKRKRVLVIGYHKSLQINPNFPSATHSKTGERSRNGEETKKWLSLSETIGDLPEALPAQEKNKANKNLPIANHEYMIGGFSYIYMSRNRKRNWDEQSFTIQAGGRHAPLHPSSSDMVKIGKDKWAFKNPNPNFRRLSVRECARIQTFPDSFTFYYQNIADGYKMIGNAVPVRLAEALAKKIKSDFDRA